MGVGDMGVGDMGVGSMGMRKGSIGMGVGNMGKGSIGMGVGDMGKGSIVVATCMLSPKPCISYLDLCCLDAQTFPLSSLGITLCI